MTDIKPPVRCQPDEHKDWWEIYDADNFFVGIGSSKGNADTIVAALNDVERMREALRYFATLGPVAQRKIAADALRPEARHD